MLKLLLFMLLLMISCSKPSYGEDGYDYDSETYKDDYHEDFFKESK